jgi:hypothetical protein
MARMVDELPPPPSGNSSSEDKAPSLSSLPYARLRWTIRITGVLLMFGGAIYLGIVAGKVLLGSLTDIKAIDGLYVVVVSLLALVLGMFIFRAGLDMLRSVDSSAVGIFSFVFALVYTSILMQIVPALALFYQYPALMLLLFLFYFGLTYLILKYILLALLFPRKKK